ncbi:glycosyltransferase family 1 protein [Lichtheimia corymbifera JMRC:FSU:9682]|uniref:sterol 3beta-glucosyltransferase n=1 Tax=Lichtheimia corymbifera JMRC:FSU:9682 TaxID=1263082 RepID=A0A068S258_9FUNG|nr:glycosyltransferase family 1 protein [Lichtheimia corymbifera JMRC:FSU:9682]
MDRLNANHNLLQFISAAAQALETDDCTANASCNGMPDNSTALDDRPSPNYERQDREIEVMLADATGNNVEDISRSIQRSREPPSSEDIIRETTLAEKLQLIFGLSKAEKLHGVWSCCMVRSAIVPGTLYLTERHVCFYASLPQNPHVYRKTGYLLVKHPTKNGFDRCFFELKDDMLAWHENATDKYSPKGKVDLKEALAVRASRKREFGFKVITMNKTWHLQADTNAAMVEWINVLQKAIFKAKNTGNSLKIALPFENILDMELTEAFEFQQFLQIRAVGIDDSFVMDEYYFTYFADANATFTSLKSTWGHSQQQNTHSLSRSLSRSGGGSGATSPTYSFPDLYENSQPIVIPPLHTMPTTTTDRSTPSPVFHVTDPTAADINDSSSSEEEEQPMVDWLAEKRRSGMKLVYGFLGGNSSGSAATVYHTADEDHVDQDTIPQSSADIKTSRSFPHEEPIDERTRANFRKYFVLPEADKLNAVYRCSLMKTLPCYGKLYISTNHVSFNSKGFATKAKMIIPFIFLHRTRKKCLSNFHPLPHAIVALQDYFSNTNGILNQSHPQINSDIKDWEARLMEEEHSETSALPQLQTDGLPILSHTSDEPLLYKKPDKPLHFTCITIGTRGDVQPYIALCKGLMADGHKCRIATHDEFKDWIEEHDIEFRSIGGDPSELMRLCVENNFFSVNFVKEGLRLFKGWIDELLEKTWIACQGTDVLIESPSAMVGVHMAEKLHVPYFRSFPMPMTKTRSFPHPFATPNNPKGWLYNGMTYVLFDHAIWRAIATSTNNFRRDVLQLSPTSYEKLDIWKIPYLYSFSPSIVPSPLDWKDWIHCTGYWFLDNPQTGWKPSDELMHFLKSKDQRPIVYIGFGSIIVSDPDDITRTIVDAVLLSNVRAIISKGWSSRLQQNKDSDTDSLLQRYPDTIISVQAVPHDWLFPQMRAVVHHGGAGTTAAGLRAGVPTIVKPFFADQFFWGERVEEMGLGLCIKDMTVEHLSAALRVVSTDASMLRMAQVLGEKIRQENGVETAIQCLYRDMELARERTLLSAQKTSQDDDNDDTTSPLEDSLVDDQEWTLIESTASGSVSPASWRPRAA